MPVPLAALALYEAATLGALAIATFFVASPQGQKAAKDTAEALSRIFNGPPEPEPEEPNRRPLPVPPVTPNLIQRCPREEPKCQCCGNPPHSKAQEVGATIPEEEFYTPRRGMKDQPKFSKELEHLLPTIRSSPCRKLLPTPGTPCSQYYLVTPRESKAARTLFADEKRNFSDDLKGKRIAHRVPLAAGGCPIGPGNLHPVPPGCMKYEEMLGKLQDEAATYHRKRMPPLPPNSSC